jgi:hydrogenase large subunit
MCFKNLPIEFDERGRARLAPGVSADEAFSKQRRPADAERPPHEIAGAPAIPPEGQGYQHEQPVPTGPAVKEAAGGHGTGAAGGNGHLKEFTIDPVTRVAGALAVHAIADLRGRKHVEVHSIATLFRGYEVILKGRDPRDAIFISSRACGVCGGVHSNAAAYAIEMALGVAPPPMGTVVRNLAETAEFLYDHPLHLFLLAGPDYSEVVVKATDPGAWDAAQRAEAPHAGVHGYRTVADIMRALNPLTGELYLQSLHVTRVAREMYSLLMGKYPHPQTMVPGGVSTTLTLQHLNEYQSRLFKLFDYGKKVAYIWDDVYDFLAAHNPAYQQVGEREKNLIDLGIWDDPEAYDASYERCAEWGERRWATPGIVRDGELVSTNLQHINIGFEEFVDHAYYAEWAEPKFPTDPVGQPLTPFHPWNKQTIPTPTGKSWKEKYTWACTPRWDRGVYETGPYSRLWITAVAQKIPRNDFIEATGHALKLRVPKGELPEMELQWHVPEVWNAFERNRGRAYSVAYTALVAFNTLRKGYELMRRGETRVSTPFAIPQKGQQIGVGYWGAGRGFLGHWLVIENGKIANYQIVTPSTIMASPRDPWGQPGAYEAAIARTPIVEQFATPEQFKAVDLLRTVRSFDPCMPCTTHVYRAGTGDRLVSRDAASCPCTLEEQPAAEVVTA